MKRQFVNMLEEGDIVNDYFLAIRKDLRNTQSGAKFLGCVFKDRTGEIGGIVWQNAVGIANQFELGQVVNVRAKVTTYRHRLQLRVDEILPLRDEEYVQEDLVHVPENIEENLDELFVILDTIENPWLKKLVQSFRDEEEFMQRFLTAAAGKRWHHAYRGGLVQHCLELAKIARTVCEVFPEVDQDMVLAGVFLHDIGKLEEMSQDLYVDYTTPGKLLGHVAIGMDIVQQHIRRIEGFPETLRLQLIHCILSHHGILENGSPVVPKTLEALALSHIDDLGAQIDAFRRVIENAKDKGDSWSDYIEMIDRQIWSKQL